MQKTPQNSQTHFDAIVVGAGAVGCNTAWHLRQRGKKVLVVEATSGPATQATGAAAGFVSTWAAIHFPMWKANEWEMQRYGLEFYTRLAKNCGSDIGFHACGIAYIYLKSDAWQAVQPKIEEARRLGTRLEILDSKRAAKLLPLVNFSQVAGIIFDPDSIRIRASDAIPALAKTLQKDGVEFRFDTRVTGFMREGNRVKGVHTLQGDIASDAVVIAAGAWSRPLVMGEGVRNCAVEPHVETRYTTRPLKGIDPELPLLIFSDTCSFYIREEKGGLLIGGGIDNPLPKDRFVDLDNPPLSHQIVPDQAYRVRKRLSDIEAAMPILKEAEIEKISSGLPTFTEDLMFVADKVPERDGLFVITACQEAGVTHGPALGRLMTELVLDGETKWDRSNFRLDRFKSAKMESFLGQSLAEIH